MKLLILCAVLSAYVAVTLANPVKIQIHDAADSSASAESTEQKVNENNSSSSSSSSEDVKGNEEITVRKFKVKDNYKDDNSRVSSEEQPETNLIVKEEVDINLSVEGEEFNDDNIIYRVRRSIVSAPHINNQLSLKDEGIIKYEKNFKLKRLRRALESDLQEFHYRDRRSADTSEENSSEEDKKDKHEVNDVLLAKKPKTAPEETLQLATKTETEPTEKDANPEGSRRRRNSPSSEEDSSEEENNENLVKSVIVDKKPETAEAENNPRPKRMSPSQESSEEKYSEEENKGASTKGVVKTAPAESAPKPERFRRRKSFEILSEEDKSRQEQDVNEVYIFSKEKQTDSEEDLNNETFKNNEYVLLSDTNLETTDLSFENKNSEEDYAQGCGGNRENDSNESSNENNETLNEKL